MKRFNLIVLAKKHKNISLFILIVLIIPSYIFISLFFYDTNFYIDNKTGKDIFFQKPELPNNADDPFLSEREEYSFQAFYPLKKDQRRTIRYDREHWNKTDRYIGLDFYKNYTTIFGSVSFFDTPTYPNQKPSCSFKIEVYSDRTVVTPTYKRFCKKPMYHYEDFNPYNPAHQPKSY